MTVTQTVHHVPTAIASSTGRILFLLNATRVLFMAHCSPQHLFRPLLPPGPERVDGTKEMRVLVCLEGQERLLVEGEGAGR